MVLESIISPLKATKKPWELFFYGLLIASIALFISYWIFDDQAGLIMVFLTTFACVPVMYGAIKAEEEKDLILDSEVSMLKEHSKVIGFFIFLFLGVFVAFVIWHVVLPTEMSTTIFSTQADTIAQINGRAGSSDGLFARIFFNNIKVLTFCLLFAFFYGAGAIFILTWNASVLATATGTLILSLLAKYGHLGGFAKAAAYTNAVSFSFIRYLLHGLPEMIAYMIAGLAGGIISAAVIRHDFMSHKFEKVLADSSDLIIISIAVLLLAAVIESYVTLRIF